MVTSVCWSSDPIGQAPFAQTTTSTASAEWRTQRPNLFSAGFDRMAFGWSVKAASNKDDAGKEKKEKASKDTF